METKWWLINCANKIDCMKNEGDFFEKITSFHLIEDYILRGNKWMILTEKYTVFIRLTVLGAY